MSSAKTIGFLLLALSVRLTCIAQFDESPKRHFKFQLEGFGVVSSYANDTRITASTQAGMGAGAGFRIDIPVSTNHKDKDLRLCAGLAIRSQGLSFDSYYFSAGYSVDFDGNLAYNHSIRITEICIPVLIRYSFSKKEESLKNSMYCTAGWELKYTLQAHTTITSNKDGTLIYDGDIDLPYEHHFLGTDVGNDIVAGVGLNHNFLPGTHALVFELNYHYGLSRNVYTGNSNSNNVLFKGSNFSFGVGLRF
ncbi:MAG: outer membrane beta-barrel protein [Bacteroidia bacterium]